MTRMEDLTRLVSESYGNKKAGRDDWSDWLYDNHVIVVADFARKLAKKYDADVELSVVAALLHDIADSEMPRINPGHEEASLRIAKELMTQSGYGAEEISLVVDDAIRYHSCHGDERPKSKEGLILATADSLAHLKTDFYVYATWAFGKDRSLESLKEWALKKIERDLNDKISFDDERNDVKPDYDAVKRLFSR